MPAPITGFDQYAEIYCDAKLWLQEGWVDILQPQLYWLIGPPQQSYPILLDWWVEQNTKGRHVYAGNYLSRIEINDWPLDEIRNQISISREGQNRIRGSWGNIMFSAKMFRDNFKAVVQFFNTWAYPYPALQPEFPWLAKQANLTALHLKNATPKIEVVGNVLQIGQDQDERIYKIVIYELSSTSIWQLVKVVTIITADQKDVHNLNLNKIELNPGRYAISGLDRFGQESRKVYYKIME